MPKKVIVPELRYHKGVDRFYARLRGVFHYFSDNEADSKQQYAQWVATLAKPVEQDFHPKITGNSTTSIAALCLLYWDDRESYHGKGADQLYLIKRAIKAITDCYAMEAANDFSPKKLLTVREHIITSSKEPLTRRYVNHQIESIRHMFQWAVPQEIVSNNTWQSLTAVEDIHKKRDKRVSESTKVQSVPQEQIDATLPCLNPVVAAMVKVQTLICCRPSEVCQMRKCDIDTTKQPWEYNLTHHKSDWREGQEEKFIAIVAEAQEILQPFIDGCESPTDYLFSPRKAVMAQNMARRDSGTYVKRNHTRRDNPSGRAGECYDKDSYRHAVIRACKKAKVPEWSPNRLRHTGATQTERKHGKEAAQLMLRHRDPNTTNIYIDRDNDDDKYRELVLKMGQQQPQKKTG